MKRLRIGLLLACTGALFSQTPVASDAIHPGPLSDGTSLLATGWRVNPAGTQIPVGAVPTSSAASPDGKYLVVLNSGRSEIGPASLSVIRTDTLAEIARVRAPDSATGPFQTWKGIAFAPNGRTLYVGGGATNSVFEFTLSDAGQLGFSKQMRAAPEAPGANDFIGDVTIAPGGRLVYAADLFHDRVVVFNPQSGAVIDRFKTGRRPYQILFHPDGKSYFVSSWADGTVYQHRTDNGQEISRIRIAPHPMGMVISDRKLADDTSRTQYRLFVAAGNTNNVFTIAIDDSGILSQADVLNVGFTAVSPAGMTPTALALSPDQTRLLVACSDANAVAVADISEPRASLLGFVPVGSYPVGLTLLSGARLAVTNAFGFEGKAGSISVVDGIWADKEVMHLDQLTDQAIALVPQVSDTDPVVSAPIDHVVYISQEAAGGTAAVADKLAREFVAVRNYAQNTTPKADRIYWSLAGFPPPMTRLAPEAWSRFNRLEGGEPANQPAAGFLWTSALSAGRTVRNYGFFVGQAANGPREKEASLQPVTNLAYPIDAVAEADRVRVFSDDMKLWQQSGQMPDLVMVRLPGTNSDRTLGALVEQISASRFWSRTATFIEGVGANGGATLTIASPYSRGLAIDDEFRNESSLLRTMELILKLRPLTMDDAAGRPLLGAFGTKADTTPFVLP